MTCHEVKMRRDFIDGPQTKAEKAKSQILIQLGWFDQQM